MGARMLAYSSMMQFRLGSASGRLATTLTLLAGLSSPAFAQDSDGDGAQDSVDLHPCDPSSSAEAFAPARGVYGQVMFEDSWPDKNDTDFNDYVVAYNYVFRLDASGRVSGLRVHLHPHHRAATLFGSVGLRIPVPSSAIAHSERSYSNGSPADSNPRLIPSGDGTIIWEEEFVGFANAWVDVTFTSPQPLDLTAAPYDLYLVIQGEFFRRGNEVHLPSYPPTDLAGPTASLLGTLDDASRPGRWFVTPNGLPFALHVPELVAVPVEGLTIEELYPSILDFAASAGTSGTGWYTAAADASRGVAGASAPAATSQQTIDRECLTPRGRTCRAIQQAGQSRGDGVYLIDPCGTGNYREMYCDMTRNGGGWTVAGRQASSAATSLGITDRGVLGSNDFSTNLQCVSFSEVMVFNATHNLHHSAAVTPRTWSFTGTNLRANQTSGAYFSQGVYGPSAMSACVDYRYSGDPGTPVYACDNDSQGGQRGHLTGYAGEYCAGGRLDNTWAWSNGSTCAYRGQQYVWGIAIR